MKDNKTQKTNRIEPYEPAAKVNFLLNFISKVGVLDPGIFCHTMIELVDGEQETLQKEFAWKKTKETNNTSNPCLGIFPARKRSLRRLCFYRCLSVHTGGHVWFFQGGMCGFLGGAWFFWEVRGFLGGRGHTWFFGGYMWFFWGCAWFFQGGMHGGDRKLDRPPLHQPNDQSVCVSTLSTLRGGMHGFSGGHAWLFPGGMCGFFGGHVWFFWGGVHGFFGGHACFFRGGA